MDSIYDIDYYCVSQSKLVSTVAAKRNVLTPDNQSKIVKLSLTFASALTLSQQK
jgi:hypothetical protein